jgi:transposase-like protein
MRPNRSALAGLACPNPDCCDCNPFGAGNLSAVESTGEHKHIRRSYCSSCGHRFSQQHGTLLRYTKIPEDTVVRAIKCLGHGCSIAAAADTCDADPRTVVRLLDQAGRRAADFHELQRERVAAPPEVVQLDELHRRVSPTPAHIRGCRASRIAPSSRRGRAWAHAALAIVGRFLIDLRLGPRTLPMAAHLVA